MTERVFSLLSECFSRINDMFQGKSDKYDCISFFLSTFAVEIVTEKVVSPDFRGYY